VQYVAVFLASVSRRIYPSRCQCLNTQSSAHPQMLTLRQRWPEFTAKCNPLNNQTDRVHVDNGVCCASFGGSFQFARQCVVLQCFLTFHLTKSPTMKPKSLTVTFRNRTEIRMGSPFNIANLYLKGDWIPDLPNEDWQDQKAWSPDGRFVALIAWAVSKSNNPGFRIYTINLEERSFAVSKRIRGCCQKLKWNDRTREFEPVRFLGRK
jgi:hypothetical protein